MVRDLSVILVVDVEATCWEGLPPEGQQGEIIEIGVAVIDVGSLKIQQRDDLLVRPVTSEVSAFCTQRTTLTPEQVAGGLPLTEACRLLRKRYASQHCTWACWGEHERTLFERQCRAQAVAFPFCKTHLNIENLYALAHHLPQPLPLGEALAHAGLVREGTPHRANEDARNMARLLIGLLQRCRRAGS